MTKPPIGQAPGKAVQVEAMFDEVAPRYDFLNRVVSGGIDIWWRKKAVQMLRAGMDRAPERLLDVATGTADLAVEMLSLNPREVVGSDISDGMLEVGRQKLARKNLDDRITLVQADAVDMPFEDGAFDGATVSFGVRNFEDLRAGLEGIRRTLKPGAPLVILETSQPTRFPFTVGYKLYVGHIMPRLGKWFSGNAEAYEYLPESAQRFPSGEAFLAELRAAGYSDCVAKPLTFGAVSLYRGLA
ncbi:bifunctional demethylmenaquinone methyltransferase/2-methoxy-6-polyprenyl-1,4-benzoquinol methylase UbiE [Rubricoccus marinus]|uniref:Demethylmenaquinone methyltransferase n=1 Tax=Rubricoccus marinus TaxID=716817 RepID=A0A259U3E8_9BACT|nr:bifunctional demethylmenaquinone methyltransferase/2-methoxy-6-polyprenyl-1,4-benzoquinol methylase UbiE [Rubricoccus marinus]OZC04334.1 bifunctional demethylmenaquinone methyltransferase/2-methoxy-6-polyprenyl-1,4-benzoquinol methylase [Rubricoccus marinus]